MIATLFTSLALAAPQPDQLDPWGRPTHARVAIEPPASIEDLYATERRFRFWWDDTGTTATIEIRGKLRWRTLAQTYLWDGPPKIATRFCLSHPFERRYAHIKPSLGTSILWPDRSSKIINKRISTVVRCHPRLRIPG